ncbi:hypothetical protein [Thiomonas intermedia]|uniref:hypothetical protein n=1 Tax=Thiomonas intermedia TaxID=926 RepID=UPI0009A54614|nr:hypothetical protein [Thiomonas intermedia]
MTTRSPAGGFIRRYEILVDARGVYTLKLEDGRIIQLSPKEKSIFQLMNSVMHDRMLAESGYRVDAAEKPAQH